MAKQEFFKKMDQVGLALSYDDVRLKSGYSEIAPADTNLSTRFTKNVTLYRPIVSSPMDTVTESKMAISMAKLGGLGIIHRNLTAEAQASEVTRVKFHLNAVIYKPITVHQDQTLRSVLEMREDKNFNFHSFPVLNDKGLLVGLITRHDFQLSSNLDLPIKK